MASWKKTIATPFKKACTFFNQQQQQQQSPHKKSTSQQHSEHDSSVTVMDLQGEVMACGYEDVQVMWSILDKSRASGCTLTS